MEKRPFSLTIFGFGSYLFALLNLSVYIMTILLMGIMWQTEVFARFVKGDGQALGLIWANYSPIIFAILLIKIGKCILNKRNQIFIKNIAAAYLTVDIIAIFSNIIIITTTFFNLIFFACLLIFITRPKVKEQFK